MLPSSDFDEFDTLDYLDSEYCEGYCHEFSCLQLILKHSDAYLAGEQSHLVIGHAGCDGIEFCFRKNKQGVWAFYPIDHEYEFKAKTIKELVVGYLGGSIKV